MSKITKLPVDMTWIVVRGFTLVECSSVQLARCVLHTRFPRDVHMWGGRLMVCKCDRAMARRKCENSIEANHVPMFTHPHNAPVLKASTQCHCSSSDILVERDQPVDQRECDQTCMPGSLRSPRHVAYIEPPRCSGNPMNPEQIIKTLPGDVSDFCLLSLGLYFTGCDQLWPVEILHPNIAA